MALQETVRDIDSGTTAFFLKIGMIATLIVGLGVLYFMIHFKGLGTEQAMDQAQIARSLVSGEGFTTRYIRPLAIKQLTNSGKQVPSANFPDFYNAPLFPLLEAAALYPVKDRLPMTTSEIIGSGDRAIALLGLSLMLLGVVAWYFVGRLLFDETLALLGAGLLLVTDLMWQYGLSGLPQHLLILLFGLVTLAAIKAMRAEENDRLVPSLVWLGVAGLGLGLMTLTHGIAAFLLPGFIAFCIFGFQSRILAFVVPMAVYLLCVAPWMLRNFEVCSNPLGLSMYAAIAGAGVTESSVMRGVNTGLSLGAGLATKFRSGFIDQASHLWEYLGLNVVAVVFLVSLMHPFRSTSAALWRWVVVLMWMGAVIGMTLFGVKGAVSGNQLHIIFLPVFVLYGTAFLLVLWNRLNITLKPLRIAFLSFVFFLAGAPMIVTLLAGSKGRIQWPPYVPPYISIIGNWFEPKEILCSDMPWAVAWYANRKCLLLPDTVRAMNEVSDYGVLGSPIVGLYLTPVSGSEEFINLVKGSYREWGPVIMRTINLNEFLLKSFTPLPIDGECILYSDRDRWSKKAEQ
jgi:4-amino-4-deoxy-L-arabinose transferase-like glycosyltransferase